MEVLAQGLWEDACRGVQLAGLPGSGSGFAVFLIHADGLRPASGGGWTGFRHAPMLKNGCYHRRSVNVL
jgi:hypothetical protein